MNLFLASLILLPAAEPAATADAWPAFRGNGSSVTTAAQLPLKWSETENLAWTASLPGFGHSSPVVWKDRVFVTAVEGPRKSKLNVLCLELTSGKVAWQRDFAASHTSGGEATAAPTPVVDGERICVLFESSDLFALDHQGKTLWQRTLSKDHGPFNVNHGFGSSMGAGDNAVVILACQRKDSYVLAVDKATGKDLWKVARPYGTAWSSPVVTAIDGQPAVVVSSSDLVDVFSLKDGKLLWSVSGLKSNDTPSPTVAGDLAVIGTGKGVVAVRLGEAKEGRIAWRAELANSEKSSPVVHAGHVYSIGRASTVFCCKLDTGAICWSVPRMVECWASPIGAGDRVYLFGTNGKTIVVKTGPTLEKLAENQLPAIGRVFGVAAVDKAILIRTGSQLFCVGKP